MPTIKVTPNQLYINDHEVPFDQEVTISAASHLTGLGGIFDRTWDYLQHEAERRGFNQVASNGRKVTFYNEEYTEDGAQTVAFDEVMKDMPSSPKYVKFLGLEVGNQNASLKDRIDELGLSGLETKIRETGFQGRRMATFGPSGVILAMTSDYKISVEY